MYYNLLITYTWGLKNCNKRGLIFKWTPTALAI